MKRIYSLVSDNIPQMNRFSVTIVEGQTDYLLQTNGTPVSWAVVTHTNVITGGDAYIIKKGMEVISSGSDTVSIDFSSIPFKLLYFLSNLIAFTSNKPSTK
jgi:hypothetical protein